MRKPYQAVALVLWLAGCGGGSGDSASSAVSVAAATPGAAYGITLTNLQIATALYLDSQRTPPGFLQDTAPPAQGPVATAHLKTTDIAALPASTYELCTNDWNQALSWSETAATYHGVYASLLGNSSTTSYFEFDRLLPDLPPVYVRQRVYLCGYLDRSDSNMAVSDGPAGVLNLKTAAAADLRQLVEYLWRFTDWNNYGSAVLSSTATPVPVATGPAHQLLIANLVAGGSGPGCDRIDILKWEHDLDPSTGALVRSLSTLWSFSAQQVGSAAAYCGG